MIVILRPDATEQQIDHIIEKAEKLGFNDSSVHTDIVSTTRRTVTAHLKNGKTKVIYKDGEFVL